MSLTRSSIVVASFSAAGILLNLAATVTIASVFGASRALDAYLAAAAIPSYAITILTGALGITFIPVFAEYRHSDPARAWRTVSAFLNLAVLITCIIVLTGVLFAGPIMRVAVPGFTRAEQQQAAELLRAYLPVVVITVANELLASIYYSHEQFAIPLLNRVITPATTIAYVLALGTQLSVMALVLATLTGAIIQCVALGIGIARRPEFQFVLTPRIYSEGVGKIVRLMGPLIAGMLIYKIVPVFDRFVLSSLPPGTIAQVNYATKLQSALIQMLSASVVLPVFPVLATIAAEKNWKKLKETMTRVIRLLLFVAVPVSISLMVFGEPLVRLVYQRGAFSARDTHIVFLCFAVYMVSLPVVVIGGIVSQGLYVLQDTKTVAIVGVGETILYVGLCMALIRRFSYLAPPLAYAIYFTASVIVLGSVFRHRLGLGGGRRLAKSFARHAGLGLTLGALALVGRRFTTASEVNAMAWCVGLVVAYFTGAHVMHSPEAVFIWEKAYATVRRVRSA